MNWQTIKRYLWSLVCPGVSHYCLFRLDSLPKEEDVPTALKTATTDYVIFYLFFNKKKKDELTAVKHPCTIPPEYRDSP
jgi:hypothetical protein